jgi:hypothetical protein
MGSAAKAPDVIHHVHAITNALKDWNDLEALRLLRRHWNGIARTVESIVQPHDQILDFPSVTRASADGDVFTDDDLYVGSAGP